MGILRRVEMRDCTLAQFFNRIENVTENMIQHGLNAKQSHDALEQTTRNGSFTIRTLDSNTDENESVARDFNKLARGFTGGEKPHGCNRCRDQNVLDGMLDIGIDTRCPEELLNDGNHQCRDDVLMTGVTSSVAGMDDVEGGSTIRGRLRGDVVIFAAHETGDGGVMALVGVYADSVKTCQNIIEACSLVTLVYN